MLKSLLKLSRVKKRAVTLLADSSSIMLSFWFAQFLRYESLPNFNNQILWLYCSSLIFLSIFSFIKLGMYRAIVRYLGITAIRNIIFSVSASTLISVVLSLFILKSLSPSTITIYFCLVLILIGGSRFLLLFYLANTSKKSKKNVLIYGAGYAGRQLASALKNGDKYHPVAFIDDDKQKQKSIIINSPVLSFIQARKIIERGDVHKVLLALPRVSRSTRNKILSDLEMFHIEIQTVPTLNELLDNRASFNELRDIDIEDLLGRDEVPPNNMLLSINIHNKVVMVSGAGGSIGAELSRQIIKLKPAKLVLFDISEFSLYKIHKELEEINIQHFLDIEIAPLLGSVQSKKHMQHIMQSFHVETVYHAAAFKHVPLVESNIVEGVRNNVFGTLATAQAAINAKVKNFVLISTDKAVRPTNFMGASKRMAELVLQALADTQPTTQFCMVRFGNVLGSSGSVVPLFRQQIKEGGPITLTHNDITRYFMTIPEAAQLVLQAGSIGGKGEVFVLDMGEPVKIRDLAEKMVRLSGLEIKDEHTPYGDIEITCTGLRPGEKLYEELLIGGDVSSTRHQKIMMAKEVKLPWTKLESILGQLNQACYRFDHQAIRDILAQAPLGFTPKTRIHDFTYNNETNTKDNDVANNELIKLYDNNV